jgi:hypothetical protein
MALKGYPGQRGSPLQGENLFAVVFMSTAVQPLALTSSSALSNLQMLNVVWGQSLPNCDVRVVRSSPNFRHDVAAPRTSKGAMNRLVDFIAGAVANP